MRIDIYNPAEPKRINSFYEAAKADYLKRLRRYSKVRCFNVSGIVGEMTNQGLPCRVIGVRKNGHSITSQELAAFLENAAIDGCKEVIFLFGDGHIASDETISIGLLDFSASLRTVMLLEQIYRAFRIIRNEPYHK
jgi:23S rRNA (pseudouridine1915-N3)-methyltransferase